MAISERAKEITDLIYQAYVSDSGVLFGLEPNKRRVVEAIVQTTLDFVALDSLKAKAREGEG